MARPAAAPATAVGDRHVRLSPVPWSWVQTGSEGHGKSGARGAVISGAEVEWRNARGPRAVRNTVLCQRFLKAWQIRRIDLLMFRLSGGDTSGTAAGRLESDRGSAGEFRGGRRRPPCAAAGLVPGVAPGARR